jgi:glycosyltransferase involved in cell wall biosynthesis
MKNSHVVVIPSLLESFGLTYYESLALEVPIVACELPFAQEACGDCALFAEPHSGASFADAIRRLLCDADLRSRLTESGKSRFLEQAWSPERVGERLLALLTDGA